MVELRCVPPDRVHEFWPHVSHLIHSAMQRGRMGRYQDVEADVLGNNAYLWLVVESNSVLGAGVTKVTNEDGERLCTIIACAGHDWERWRGLIEGIEKYARAEGCTAMEICGRPGWSRRLKDYRTVKIVIRKELDNGWDIEKPE